MKKLLFLAGILLATTAQDGQQAIPVQNYSFESTPPLTAGQCGPIGGTAPGWTFGSDSGVFQPTNPNPCSGVPLPLPDGKKVAYAGNGGAFSQDLGVKASSLQAVSDVVYNLKFSVANYFGGYPGYYEAKISLGTHELCSTDGWGTQKWAQVTLVCPSPHYLVFYRWPDGTAFDLNDHLSISFSGTGWILLFDNVSLTFSPN
jgi:hapalindole biogenesis HpiC1 cyclase-like protein